MQTLLSQKKIEKKMYFGFKFTFFIEWPLYIYIYIYIYITDVQVLANQLQFICNSYVRTQDVV